MSSAGNADTLLRMFKRVAHVMVFLAIFAGSFIAVSTLFPRSSTYIDVSQRLFVILSVSSFTTLVISTVLHVSLQSRITLRVLVMSSAFFIIMYYIHFSNKVLSNGLSVIPYPFLIELKGNAYSAYVLDLPQIIITGFIAYYIYKRVCRRRSIPALEELQEGCVLEDRPSAT